MRVEVLKQSLCSIRVCSDGSYEETLEWLKKNLPSGTSNNWCEADEVLYDGSNRTIVCANNKTRFHYVYNC